MKGVFSKVGILLLTTALSGCYEKATSYEDCVLDMYKENHQSGFASSIERQCRAKTLREGNLDQLLPDKALLYLTGRMSYDNTLDSKAVYKDRLSVKLYNGNPTYYVTTVNVKVDYALTKLLDLDAQEGLSQIIALDVSIPPYSIRTYKFDTFDSNNPIRYKFEGWDIVSARGIHKESNSSN